MSEQQSLNNSVDDSGNVARTIEEKPGGNTASNGNDLKQPVTGESSDLDKKKKRFQITSIESENDDVEESDMGSLQHSTENIAVLDQNSDAKTDSNSGNVMPKKKISFQVTSIESKEGRRRGDSNGYDDMDELNESEFLEEEGESPDIALSHVSGNGNGSSRFKVVKIPRYDSKPYMRGGWQCWDFVSVDDAPPSALPYLRECKSDVGEESEQDSVTSSGISEVNSACSGLESKGTNSNIELLIREGSVQQNICETQIQEEKNPSVVKNDFVGNPGSPRVDERVDILINNSSGLGKSFETQTIQSVGTLPQADETILRLQDLSEDEVVAEKIKKAMNQVVQIKTDLLQDVNADVKKLKQIIQQLTNENHRLKEENELLKQKLSNQTKTESI